VTKRQFLILIVPLLAVILGLAGIGIADRAGADPAYWDDDLVLEVRRALDREFVWGIDEERRLPEKAFYEAVNTYIGIFDAYGEVVPPWLLEEEKDRTHGRYAGVGLLTPPHAPNQTIDSLTIDGVFPGGPADRAGIKIGEQIVAVDRITLAELGSASRVIERIRGPSGSTVKLGVKGRDGNEREVEVVRAPISKGSVFGARLVDADAGIGYLRIKGFFGDTDTDFRKKLEALKEMGMVALVLDLRQNPGGMLDTAVNVVDALISDGIIVQVQSRDALEVKTATPENTLAPDLPLAVLVNRGSASAAEVVAGAIQDHRRGVLVGGRTWGKFAVQTLREIPSREANAALLKITSALYKTPNGHYYQRRYRDRRRDDPLAGLVPDLHVPVSHVDRDKLEAIFRSEEYADWREKVVSPYPDFEDEALSAAVAILRGQDVRPLLRLAEAGDLDDPQ
jgi:carboxyl-terminal processing protease